MNLDALERLQLLYNVFSTSLRLALYVQDAYLVGDINEGWENHDDELIILGQIIPHMLSLLQRVRRIKLTHLSQLRSRRDLSRKGRWTDYPEALKAAILEFCKIPSVIHITISHIRDFPISILATCSGLKKLSLSDLDFHVYDARSIELYLQGMTVPETQTHLDVLEMDQSFSKFFPLIAQAFRHPNSIVNLCKLRALKIVGSLPNSTHLVWEDIDRFAPALECLMWNQATDWEGRTVISKFYAEPLNLAQMKNMRYLILKFLADFNKYNIIPNIDWLSESLHRLRWSNQIEEITIILIYESWNRDNTNALLSIWTKRLDTVVCGAGFPVLRRIRIILADFADRVRRFTVEVKPRLGLQVGELFQIEPLRNDSADIWKQVVVRFMG
ncbi:hypothetical protein BDZ94DRAFT_1273614 [Collybia nuda]|uniref:Uncharacterized protein n=1 Tax=Collybia nuda TaxID=64659 RepID=A0A9P6CCM6_9AGAR|nr:hypothetical protein BDZ94DRAFT_1273614 [Collybia nuda]